MHHYIVILVIEFLFDFENSFIGKQDSVACIFLKNIFSNSLHLS